MLMMTQTGQIIALLGKLLLVGLLAVALCLARRGRRCRGREHRALSRPESSRTLSIEQAGELAMFVPAMSLLLLL